MDITAVELAERIGLGEALNLLDVREVFEYSTFNIGGVNVPLSRLAEKTGSLGWNKNDEVVVICKIGMRSNTGKLILQQQGYTNVKNLSGGLIALQRAGNKA